MPSDQPGEPANLDPDQISTRSFERSRRGYDEDEVRAYLVSLASQLRVAQQQQADTQRRLAQVERRTADLGELDLSQLTVLLGEETARVLEAARTAADEIRGKAEDAAARLVREASDQATSTRTAADEYADEMRSAADRDAAQQRTAADEYATTVRRDADEASQAARSGADSYALEVRSAADADVQALRADAEADAGRLRGEAETVLDERTAVAEEEASKIRAGAEEALRTATDHAAVLRSVAEEETAALRERTAEAVADLEHAAQTEADELLATSRREAEAIRAGAEADALAAREAAESDAIDIRTAARDDGRTMVEESRAYREKVIADLAERRRVARLALDELHERRRALLDALSQVSVRLATASADLTTALPDPDDVGDTSVDRAALGADEPVAPTAAPAPAEPEPAPTEATGIAVGEISPPPPPPPRPAEDAPSAINGTSDHGVAETAAREEPAGIVDGPAGEAEVGGDEPRGIDAIFAELKAGGTTAEVAQVHVDETSAVATVALAVAEGTIPANPSVDDAEVDEPAAADEVDPGSDEGLLARRDDAIVDIARRVARQLKRELSTEENEVLDRLRRGKGEPDAAEALPDAGEHVARYQALVATELAAAAHAGAGFFPDASGAAGAVEVHDLAGDLAGTLVGQLRGRLERAFTDGGDEAEVADRVRASYREWKTERIAGSAEDSVLAAFGRGVFEAAPEGTSFRWLVDDGEHPCPDCDDDALAGAVPKGEPFPTGARMAPAHPGCRCLIVPVPAASS